MRRSLAAALVCLGAFGWQLLSIGGAGAAGESLVDHGWWYRAHQRALAPVEPPPPPTVPKEGLYVAKQPTPPPNILPSSPVDEEAEPAEPAAVAALSYMGDTGPGAVLELKVASLSAPPAPHQRVREEAPWEILACPLTAPWAGGQAQMWDNRPVGLCELVALPGEFVPNRESPTSVIWKLNEVFESFPQFWSILLVPDPGPVPFEISFEHPSTGSFVVDPGFGEDEEEGALGPLSDDAFASLMDPFDSGFADPFLGSTDGLGELDAVDLATDTAPAAPGDVGPRGVREAPDDLQARAIALLALAALTAGLWALTRDTPRPAVAAGSSSPAPQDLSPIGGIGRFARARAEPPRGLL
ncbi:MAG TPA: hypothetical protein VM840_00245 [Actinomycetota bacterium]|nr:hypothetical protein [Actinomycetota bacterium]